MGSSSPAPLVASSLIPGHPAVFFVPLDRKVRGRRLSDRRGRCPESEPRTKSCCSASLNVPGHWPTRCPPSRQRERESAAHRGNGSGATSRGCGPKVGPIPSRLRANLEESAPETRFLVLAPAPHEGTAESFTRRTILGKEASGRGSFGRGAHTKLENLDVRATRAPHRPRSFPGRRAPSAGKSQIE